MRQRKVKNEKEKLQMNDAYLVKNAKSYIGRWRELFGNNNDIYLELGCGKGQFIMTLAEQNPQNNYIGIEGQSSILLRALEKATELKLKNIFFVREFVGNINEFFDENELDGIYLNFSDPWPKDRHAKRRLTHKRYLEGYRKILKQHSFIQFKSDNDLLFAFTMEQFEDNNLQILEYTDDLHNSNFLSKNVTTEYEDKFKSLGKNINYCKARF
ncbi:tRNA (guanosine(46)-N7)-methyltransferase TrmB [Anaerovorax odorimutans]|uniref:tRNA (guanosine(46)-N7)-methyltransferase TrmB n=1 Tax=Anaerovorax odorimutans TaxID=109327 RepID=UPI00040A0FB2|nr:tRNA (guanosine(46)-N7)-methyltransferase TrmB [Anaerovorax odorimutans]